MPAMDEDGRINFHSPVADKEETGSAQVPASRKLGVVLRGQFDSFFAHKENPVDIPGDKDSTGSPRKRITGLLDRSPESARIILYASNDFMDDQVLASIVATTGTQYLGPLELFMNTLDWALKDDQLKSIRSRAHFNRTLPPMERRIQLLIEYCNYGLALLWLLVLASASGLHNILRRRHYARGLSL